MKLLETNPVPVVPLALQNLWGSFFSRAGGKAMSRPFRRGVFSRVGLVAGDRVAPAAVTPAGLRDAGRRCAERVGVALELAPPRAGREPALREAALAPVARGPMRSYSEITWAPKQQQRRRDLEAQQHDDRRRQRAVDDVTCDSVAKYQTSTWRVISQSSAAVTPPISAWRQARRPAGMTR